MVVEEQLVLAGRVLLGGYFAFTGLNHFMKSEQMAGWIKSKGYPQSELINYLGGGLLLISGLDVVFGTFPAVAWGALTTFLVAASLFFHDFWNMEGEEKQQQMTHFLKNIGLIGGLLFYAALVASGNYGPALMQLAPLA